MAKLCSVCREPQFETSSGICCINGHGGADSIYGEKKYADGLEEAANIAAVIQLLTTLDPCVRVNIFNKFCTHCGAADPKCPCWNDE